MSALELIALLGVFGCIVAGSVAVMTLFEVGSRTDVELGSPSLAPPPDQEPRRLPRDLEDLLRMDHRMLAGSVQQWQRFVDRLDRIELELGLDPRTGPAPVEYSFSWLQYRIGDLERRAGMRSVHVQGERR